MLARVAKRSARQLRAFLTHASTVVVCLYICLYVGDEDGPTETVELTEMPFGVQQTRVSLWNHVLSIII